jgi:hypothetical protein
VCRAALPDHPGEIDVPDQNLRIPGPTPLPAAVREAGSRQMVNHRGPEFKELLGRVSGRMKAAFRTGNDVLVLTASGTGGLEAAVVSTLSRTWQRPRAQRLPTRCSSWTPSAGWARCRSRWTPGALMSS